MLGMVSKYPFNPIPYDSRRPCILVAHVAKRAAPYIPLALWLGVQTHHMKYVRFLMGLY